MDTCAALSPISTWLVCLAGLISGRRIEARICLTTQHVTVTPISTSTSRNSAPITPKLNISANGRALGVSSPSVPLGLDVGSKARSETVRKVITISVMYTVIQEIFYFNFVAIKKLKLVTSKCNLY